MREAYKNVFSYSFTYCKKLSIYRLKSSISTDSNESENGKAQGVITRVDLCTNLADYSTPTGTYLTNGGNSKNCAENFTWSWKQGAGNKHAKLNWMALSPDETYILAVGAKGLS